MIVHGYATLAELKLELGIATAETTDDTKIELAVEAASRWIDDRSGWRFYTSSSDETRY